MLIHQLPRCRDRERGQTLAVFAIFLVVLLGSTALAVDYGSWLNARRTYQNVVDAAVLQGSVLLERPVDFNKQLNARRATWQSINDQLALGLPDGVLDGFAASDTPVGSPETPGDYRIWVSTPPLGGPGGYGGNYSGSNRVMFAWIDRENSAFFSRILGIGDQRISAWATSGSFPNRFAVITLRKSTEAGPNNTQDIAINGTGTRLKVIDGDVGGNWSMRVNGNGARLQIASTTGDVYGLYLTQQIPSGPNSWTSNQLVDGAGNPAPATFHAEVADPNYPSPCVDFSVAGCLVDRGSVTITGQAKNADGSCSVAADNSNRLAPGRYDSIQIQNGKCAVLDPTYLPVSGKNNGIYYITDEVDLNNDSLLVGDGVTLVFASGSNFIVQGGAGGNGAVVTLNRGDTAWNPLASACGGLACKYGAWTTLGDLTWTVGDSPLPAVHGTPSNPFARGLAVYVQRSANLTQTVIGFQAGAGLDYRGLIYAPTDNVQLSGQPSHNDIGQLVAWTVFFSGGTEIEQTWDGPDSNTPVLLEPRLGQ